MGEPVEAEMFEHERIAIETCGCHTDKKTGLTTKYCSEHGESFCMTNAEATRQFCRETGCTEKQLKDYLESMGFGEGDRP